jgi:hypothetical protein
MNLSLSVLPHFIHSSDKVQWFLPCILGHRISVFFLLRGLHPGCEQLIANRISSCKCSKLEGRMRISPHALEGRMRISPHASASWKDAGTPSRCKTICIIHAYVSWPQSQAAAGLDWTYLSNVDISELA